MNCNWLGSGAEAGGFTAVSWKAATERKYTGAVGTEGAWRRRRQHLDFNFGLRDLSYFNFGLRIFRITSTQDLEYLSYFNSGLRIS